jgi:hypothetical protein
MNYDRNIFDKYRALAVTTRNDIVIGETYYSTYREAPFIAIALCQDEYNNTDKILTDQGDLFGPIYEFCSDNNIGASYNPWLIFNNKEDYDNCMRDLVVTFSEYN